MEQTRNTTVKEPTKAADAQYSYKFTGWNPAVSPVTGDVTYKAQFEAVTNKYTVTWVNWDNKELEKDEDVPYGADPEYDGEEPTKAADAQYSYKFTGWNPAVSPVTGDVTYKAQFEAVTNKYTVTWVNWDNKELEKDEDVPYGADPEYDGEEPTKAADAQYTYTFKGWTPEVETVTGDATYKATYTKEANSYTLTYDLDGGEWENDTTYTYPKKYNEEVEVKADPTKEGYTFAGWTSAEVKVVNGKFTMPAKNVTLTAQWKANIYKVTYDLDGGEWTETTNEFPYEYKATVEVIKTVPTREGYKFSGWRSEEVTIENDAFTMPAKDVVLKAVWEANPTPTPIPSEEPTPTPAPSEEPTPTPAPTEEPTPTPGSDRRTYTYTGSDRRAYTYTGSDRRAYTYTGSDRRAYTYSGSDRRADTYTGSDRRVYTYSGSKSEPESEPGNTYSDAGSSGRSGYGCNTHPDTDCHTFHNAER
ncbi:MAG: InlB B-repeat-containing protein [Oscillospiraceae bacterium]